MLPSTCVVVPTYWTRAQGGVRLGDAAYDHPTSIDGTSTLIPLLDSLATLDTSSFYLLLLVGVTAVDAEAAAIARVEEIAGQYPGLISLVFGPADLDRLHRRLEQLDLHKATTYLDLREYARIRNLQLAVPQALGTAAIVALDDDEIVVDAEFLSKATGPLGTTVNGKCVDGLSGHYLQDDGGILLRIDPQKARSKNLFTRKAAVMNAASQVLEEKPGNLVETPFCFGGNMEFSAELAASVGFDPGITRGEDIDYLINARMEGKTFFLRKDLRILHRPPSGGSYKDANISKLEQDIIRFVYEHAKLELSRRSNQLHSVTAEDLMPYPGDFLTDDIDRHACAALEEAGYQGKPADFVKQIREGIPQRLSQYLEFRQTWPLMMDALGSDRPLRTQLLGRFTGL